MVPGSIPGGRIFFILRHFGENLLCAVLLAVRAIAASPFFGRGVAEQGSKRSLSSVVRAMVL